MSSNCGKSNLEGEQRTMSSAKKMQAMMSCMTWQPKPEDFKSPIKSCIYIAKNLGDKIPPCFVPVGISNALLMEFSHLTVHDMFK